MTCWCGEEGAHFDDDGLDLRCGGLGTLYCRCGGDLCVCHNHGEVFCDGCPDCEDPDDRDEELL